MIKTYNDSDIGRTRVFFVFDGGVVVGNRSICTHAGIQFYVDDYVAEQIHKCELYFDGFTPKLRVKEGETLFVPEENDEYKKRKKIEELEQKLKELKGDEDNEV